MLHTDWSPGSPKGHVFVVVFRRFLSTSRFERENSWFGKVVLPKYNSSVKFATSNDWLNGIWLAGWLCSSIVIAPSICLPVVERVQRSRKLHLVCGMLVWTELNWVEFSAKMAATGNVWRNEWTDTCANLCQLISNGQLILSARAKVWSSVKNNCYKVNRD